MEDREIVELYWMRNADAITQTDRKYGNFLSGQEERVLKNPEDADAGRNDTYLQAWNTMPPQRPSYLCAYLSTILRRLSIDLYRKKHAEKRRSDEYAVALSELEEILPAKNPAADIVSLHTLGDTISAYLRTQPLRNRNLFILRYFFFDTVEEAAKHCGIRAGNARTILHRMRQELKQYLIQEGYDL